MGIKCPKCHFDNPSDSKFCKECGTQIIPLKEIPVTETLETPKEELTTGSTFAGRYQIIEELGKGGMGKVYRVLDKELKEEVALKLIKPEIASDKNTLERFSNELKLARKISHKNVGRMYELMEDRGTRYITMEYVPGEDLKGMIRMVGQLGAGKSISIAKQVCEGLTEAHRLGVVHRDLKPSNIMIDKEGNARILDFGIARSLKAKGITGAGVMVGTPEYMSPEQAEVKEVDQRSDIYSLGVILYEMVTGRVPFEGETPLGIAMKHKSEMPKDPRDLNTQIPEDLSQVILRCMEKNKENRYQSAGEVRSHLEGIEKGIPTTERVIPERKPLTSREITVTFGLRKIFIPVIAAIALAIIAVIIWRVLPRKEAVPVPAGKAVLGIMYFENNTGDESLDHYRKALSDLLIADLSQSKYINVLRGDKLFNILSQLNQLEAKTYSSDILREIAIRGRVTHILQGNYTKAGENFRINSMLHNTVTEELISSETVEGRGEESIFSMVDELTRRIKAGLKLTEKEIASDLDKEVGKITTSSIEAFRFYSEGRKHHDTGEFRQSIQLMEKALAIDPEFAMAYRSMAMSYGNMGYPGERRKYLKKAFELSDRASDRERYIIQGDFYREKEGTYDKAIEVYDKLIEVYPEDSIGNNNVALLYNNLEQWDTAIERLEVLRQSKDESPYVYNGLASAYRGKGMYDEARKVFEGYLKDFPDNTVIYFPFSNSLLCQGEYDLAFSQVEKLSPVYAKLFQTHRLKGNLYRYKGDLEKAEKEYLKLLEHEEQAARLTGRDVLSALYQLQGKFEKAKSHTSQGIELAKKLADKEQEQNFLWTLSNSNLRAGNLDQALVCVNRTWENALEEQSLFWQRWALFLKGLIYVEMKKSNEARATAEELKEMIEKGMNLKLMRFYHYLKGFVELEDGNFDSAIIYFNEAVSLLSYQRSRSSDDHALFLDPLAYAYYKAGNLDKARQEYERITTLSTGQYYYGDIYAKSYYRLGLIHEQQDNKAKAIEHYEKFLDLWKDADPGIAEVEDAKKRLAGLR